MKKIIPPERIKEYITYDKETGFFIRNKYFYGYYQKPRILKTINRYLSVFFEKRMYRAHDLAWWWENNKYPDGIIDHINGNGLDNRIANLRDVTFKENLRNRKEHRNGNYFGVQFDKSKKKWASFVNRKFIGRYPCEHQAAMAVAMYENYETVNGKTRKKTDFVSI